MWKNSSNAGVYFAIVAQSFVLQIIASGLCGTTVSHEHWCSKRYETGVYVGRWWWTACVCESVGLPGMFFASSQLK